MKLSRLLFFLSMTTACALAATSGIHGRVAAGPPARTVPGAFAPPPARSVVWAINSKRPTPTHPFAMNQKWMAFQPHVLVVPLGATVVFKNSDTVEHNVNWRSIGGDRALAKNLGDARPGQILQYRFTHPGVVHVRCRLHPTMSAYIVVVPTPYFTTTKRSGAFRLVLPPGRYRVVAWHEGRAERSREVTVGAAPVAVNFNLH